MTTWTPGSELDDCRTCQQIRVTQAQSLAALGFSAPYWLGKEDESVDAVDCLFCGAMIAVGEQINTHIRWHQ